MEADKLIPLGTVLLEVIPSGIAAAILLLRLTTSTLVRNMICDSETTSMKWLRHLASWRNICAHQPHFATERKLLLTAVINFLDLLSIWYIPEDWISKILKEQTYDLPMVTDLRGFGINDIDLYVPCGNFESYLMIT